MDYRNTEEKNYYGSDLNKFVNEECSKEMTVINIDMLEYKRSLKKIRIIESKHNNERMPKSQEEILKIFAKIFRFLNGLSDWINTQFNIDFKYYELFIVTGTFPYKTTRIDDWVNNKSFNLDNENLKRFLEFKDFDHIPKESHESDLSEV